MAEIKHQPGMETLKICVTQVTLTIRNNFEEITGFLKDEEIIKWSFYREIIDPQAKSTPDSRARMVSLKLIDKVEESDDTYNTFVNYLREKIKSEYTVQLLDKTYAEQKKTIHIEDTTKTDESNRKTLEQVDDRRRAEEADRRAQEAERRSEEEHRRAEEADRRAEEEHRRATRADRRADEAERRAEEEHRRAARVDQRADEADRRADKADRSVQEVDSIAEEAHTRAEQLINAYDEQWMVRREEIDLTGPEIGRGAWAIVSLAEFRGVQVAVKRLYNNIVSRFTEDKFCREMQMAAKVRHPNLVQFIGATVEGDMMILMEYMPTSLRRQLQIDECLQPNTVKYLSLDINRALNYLHQMQPDPMIHLDISSANILLEPSQPPKYWKAKITDYGSANLVRQLDTQNPGSPLYSAPEACNPSQQTPKMDIYSFGVLILEMLTGRLVDRQNRPLLIRQVHHEQFLRLIRRCLSETPSDRPSAHDIISEFA